MSNFLTTLRTLDAAATPGPWEIFVDDDETRDDDPERFWACGPRHYDPQITIKKCDRTGFIKATKDATLIAYLRNHAAAIIGCVEALERLRDCDWVITPADRMDAVRKIARDALAALEEK